MPDHFDKILRENISRVILPFSKRYFGFTIVSAEDLESKLQVTTGREADFVKLVETEEGEEFILHLEYQMDNDPNMVYRMQTYHALLMQKYKREVRQFVLYLGNSEPTMRTDLKENEITRGFELKNLRDFDHRDFTRSRVPEEIILAILSDFQEKDPHAVIRLILERLEKEVKDQNAFTRVMKQLGMLSRIRKLHSIVYEESKNMAFTYDIKTDEMFQKGMEKGMEKGIAKGDRRRQVQTARNLLRMKRMSIGAISKATGLSEREVKRLEKELNS